MKRVQSAPAGPQPRETLCTTRFGDWFDWLMVVGLVGLLGFAWMKRK